MSKQESVADTYKESIQILDSLNIKLKEFLQHDKSITISNKDYMEAYNKVHKTSDLGANPCETQNRNKINYEEQLYKHFLQLLQSYLKEDVEIVKKIEDDEKFVEVIEKQYSRYKMYLHWQWKIFQYLDRFYLKNKETNLKIVGFQSYRTEYWDHIKQKVFNVVKKFQFDHLRQGMMIPKQTIQTLVQIFTFIGFKGKSFYFQKQESVDELEYNVKFGDQNGMYVFSKFTECKDSYEQDFQTEFAKQLEIFYQQKVGQWKSLSTPEYVSEVLKALETEKQIAQYYYPFSEVPMMQIIQKITIEEVAEIIANNESTGVFFMLQNSKEKQLKDIYTLFSYDSTVRDTLKYIAIKFEEHLKLHGTSYQTEAEQQKNEKKSQKDIAIEYIGKVQKLRKRSENLMEKVFNNDLVLQNARDKAFQSFLNHYDRSTFYLALHSDNLLKSESFNNEKEVEEELNNILKIFYSLYSRDAFFKHYQKFLSNRLLNGTSKNQNAENELIAKFKTEAGQSAVSKIQTMYQDIEQSKQSMKSQEESINKEIDYILEVKVLTQGCWPLQQTENQSEQEKPEYPMIIQKTISSFFDKYKQIHQGRNLNFVFSQGVAEINFNVKDKEGKQSKYVLICNSYQFLFLMCIDESGGKVQYADVLKRTLVNGDDILYNLQPFFKLKILERQQKDGIFDQNETIRVCDQFAYKQKKIKCIPGGKAEKSKNDKQNEENMKEIKRQIEEERGFVIDATIVRIMKGKRELPYNQLLPECINMITNFKAEIQMIKRRVESLIDRDYLKRDQTDINKLIYVP